MLEPMGPLAAPGDVDRQLRALVVLAALMLPDAKVVSAGSLARHGWQPDWAQIKRFLRLQGLPGGMATCGSHIVHVSFHPCLGHHRLQPAIRSRPVLPRCCLWCPLSLSLPAARGSRSGSVPDTNRAKDVVL
jgi:hypothetical protein